MRWKKVDARQNLPCPTDYLQATLYAGCSIVKTPLVTIGYESSYDVFLLSWQSRAISNGLGPALLKVSDSHRSPLKQESLPTRDARVDWVVKTKKAGLRKARKHLQHSKR
ncbi:UNVERIFIED_CONTAM: 30S ribosomal protein S9, chloroplastic [Sesamum radiatum]|uniref:30S ribosomal protein S9, chloroplastic n=1 Tax=Sesamum radiatum TaxID=300843 RepID=A0AAW2SHS5_SESRA